MAPKRFLRLQLLVVLTLLACSFAHNSVAKSFFWQVNSATATVYLLGSIHIATDDFYPLASEIEAAFEQSPILVLEINQNKLDPAFLQAEMLKISLYPGNETIKDHIDGETFSLLSHYMASNGIPIEPFLKFKPSMLAMTLSLAKLNAIGYRAQFGIDEYFLNKATGKKTILELEDYHTQLDLLASLPNEPWYLRYALEQMDNIESQIHEIATAWKQGDTEKMRKIILLDVKKDYPNIEEVYDRMFYQRNKNMTKKISAYLSTPKTYFVIVGAGHLVGKKGIITLLSKRGFKPKQF